MQGEKDDMLFWVFGESGSIQQPDNQTELPLCFAGVLIQASETSSQSQKKIYLTLTQHILSLWWKIITLSVTFIQFELLSDAVNWRTVHLHAPFFSARWLVTGIFWRRVGHLCSCQRSFHFLSFSFVSFITCNRSPTSCCSSSHHATEQSDTPINSDSLYCQTIQIQVFGAE